MEKQPLVKDDGRYIIFYEFGHSEPESGKYEKNDEENGKDERSESERGAR